MTAQIQTKIDRLTTMLSATQVSKQTVALIYPGRETVYEAIFNKLCDLDERQNVTFSAESPPFIKKTVMVTAFADFSHDNIIAIMTENNDIFVHDETMHGRSNPTMVYMFTKADPGCFYFELNDTKTLFLKWTNNISDVIMFTKI